MSTHEYGPSFMVWIYGFNGVSVGPNEGLNIEVQPMMFPTCIKWDFVCFFLFLFKLYKFLVEFLGLI